MLIRALVESYFTLFGRNKLASCQCKSGFMVQFVFAVAIYEK